MCSFFVDLISWCRFIYNAQIKVTVEVHLNMYISYYTSSPIFHNQWSLFNTYYRNYHLVSCQNHADIHKIEKKVEWYLNNDTYQNQDKEKLKLKNRAGVKNGGGRGWESRIFFILALVTKLSVVAHGPFFLSFFFLDGIVPTL